MKQVLAIVMALALAIALAACGTTPAAPNTNDKNAIAIHRGEIVAAFAGSEWEVVQQSTLLPQPPREPSTRTYTGVPLRHLLEQHMDDIPAGAALLAQARDGISVTYNYEIFMADTTLLAWYEDRYNDGNRVAVTRIVVQEGTAALFLQQVASLTLIIADEPVPYTDDTGEPLGEENDFALPELPPQNPHDAIAETPNEEVAQTQLQTTEAMAAARTTTRAVSAAATTTSAAATTSAVTTTTTRAATTAVTRSTVSSRPTFAGQTTTTRAQSITTTMVTITTTQQQTQPTVPQAPASIQVNRAALVSQFAGTAQQVVQQAHMVDTIGRESHRTYTGVAIRNILERNGVNLSAIPASATLRVAAADGAAVTLTHAEFMAPTTLLAWHEVRHSDNSSTDLANPRLVFPSGLSARFLQHVTTLTLTF